jgi:DNA-binding beta-propeller fold protein YncE
MKNKIKLLAFLVPIMFISCEGNNAEPDLFPQGEGVFILNEGNFMAGNGTVSFYSLETGEIYNELFKTMNSRPLGDVPTFIATDGTTGYIIVNNSGTLEAVDMLTMESLGTITGLSSPRQMAISGRRAYVTSIASGELTVIDLDLLEVTGHIDIGCTSEAIVISDGVLFASNWVAGDRIVVVDLETEDLIGFVTTGTEPESMVLDKNGKLWVLCTGGYMQDLPKLVRINSVTYEKESEMIFGSVSDYPASLAINSTGDTLYWLHEGIRRMPVSAVSLPGEAFIEPGERLFYDIGTGPGGRIFVTDAIDYQQKGDLLIYNSRGELEDTEKAGIIPGFMRFMTEW